MLSRVAVMTDDHVHARLLMKTERSLLSQRIRPPVRERLSDAVGPLLYCATGAARGTHIQGCGLHVASDAVSPEAMSPGTLASW